MFSLCRRSLHGGREAVDKKADEREFERDVAAELSELKDEFQLQFEQKTTKYKQELHKWKDQKRLKVGWGSTSTF